MPKETYNLPVPTPETYLDEAALTESLHRKGTAKPGDGLYPRDGTRAVQLIEDQIAEVTLGEQVHNVILASGMAAAREAVIFAASKKGQEAEQRDYPTIAYGQELYSQSLKHFRNLANMGVFVMPFDSGKEEELSALIEDKRVDVIFAETVANTPGMPVLNVHSLLELLREADDPPIVILDNTLPLSTGLDFSKLLKPDDPVLVVESGTKNLMNNSELLGIVYSLNLELIEEFRKHKAHSGAINSISAGIAISDTLKVTAPEFHDRNRAVFSSAGRMALALLEAQEILGAEADFDITFPSFPSHPNYDYARRITPPGMESISPVVFITDAYFRDATPLIRRVSEHPAVRNFINEGEIKLPQDSQGAIGLGQSFGFPKARLLYDMNAPNVRFAGGFDLSDEAALAAAIKEAAADR